MKKRVITGLVAIFVVVAVGGGLSSHNMRKLTTMNSARFIVEEASHEAYELDIMVLQTIKGIRHLSYRQGDIRQFVTDMSRVQVAMRGLEEHLLSRRLAAQSCGMCHERPEHLITGLTAITRKMESTFSDLTMLASILITGGAENGVETVIGGMGETLELFHGNVHSLNGILLPMIQHINEQVNADILNARRTQDTMIIITTLFVLLAILVLASAMTKPIHLLSEGTEAIVKGDYDHRIELKGRDELSVLAERFNYMAEVLSNRERRLHQKKIELEDLNKTLERRVRERTKALRDKQEEINRKYLELESANEELQASYVQLQSTAAELEEAQGKLQENNDALQAMNTELARANEVKNKFLSIMSHELRTPLTVINGYLSLVLDKNYGNPSRELRDIIAVVKEQGNNQLGLIEDLLDLTRIESGELKLFKQEVDPRNIIEKAVENFRPKYEEKGIIVEIQADEDVPEVFWDSQKMLQVFQNLLDNALKFTPSGGMVDISARSKSDFVELRLSDNGIGIPKEQMGQIFERFYQVDSSPTRRFGGSGLGLSIVREIVMAHNGKIFVESEEGHGTSFLILMPIGEADKAKGDKYTLVGAGNVPRTAPRGDGEKILVVDDDEAFLKMMKMILPREGYRVHSTADSTKVIQQAKKFKADLIMLDLMMPGMDGYDVCRMVRRDEGVRGTPILVVSAAGGKEVARRVFEAGADEHVTKPFDQGDLLNRIHALLEQGKKASGDDEADGRGGEEAGPPAS